MNITKAIENIGTKTEIKRVCNAYVVDFRNLDDDELREALNKTSPQYYFADNVNKTLNQLLFKADRDTRILVPLFLKQVLLEKDDFMCPEKQTNSEIVKYQQSIVDQANEDLFGKTSPRKKNFEIFNYLLEAAWEYDDSISLEEKNLIEKVRRNLKITEKEYRILEARLGKYPKQSNRLHSVEEIEEVRRRLQHEGIVFPVRDNGNTSFDLLPEEVAKTVRNYFGIEMKTYGYRKLLDMKFVRSKKYFTEILKKRDVDIDGCSTLDDLMEKCVERVNPREILGGFSSRDGVSVGNLKKWCQELKINVSGTKDEIIDRIVNFYDNLRFRTEEADDERKVWYEQYAEFAGRKLTALRSQQLISKDIEVERRFEEATNYLFEKKLQHKPLTQVGTSRADGTLSYEDQFILWDNKSKETEVNLKDHLRQFDGYIASSEKPVACFLVIGPSFTKESASLAMQYKVDNQVTIALITAEELKDIAEKWSVKNQGPFPLGYFNQVGRFNPEMVQIG